MQQAVACIPFNHLRGSRNGRAIVQLVLNVGWIMTQRNSHTVYNIKGRLKIQGF